MDLNDRLNLTLAAVAFFSVAGLTWFFASRPRLFVRVFVPSHEWREAVRHILRDPQFGRGMRTMALLQAAVAMAFGLAATWCWFKA